MRPVCSTGCDACASCGGTCSSCATVTQAVYQETPSCVGCASGGSAPAARAPSQSRPTLAPQEDVPAERQYLEKPATESDSLDQLDPVPASDEAEDGSANFDAPRLFSPDDRAAQLGAPVWTAVYRRQISGSKTEARAVSHHQVMQDAAGWTSASQ